MYKTNTASAKDGIDKTIKTKNDKKTEFVSCSSTLFLMEREFQEYFPSLSKYQKIFFFRSLFENSEPFSNLKNV